jgi:hypothetical protein
MVNSPLHTTLITTKDHDDQFENRRFFFNYLQVPRHPNFRLVAAMNPATDAGKRELPPALRNRFTEIWVPEPSQREDLRSLVYSYLAGVSGPAPPVDNVVDFYIAAKTEAVSSKQCMVFLLFEDLP